MAGHRPWKEIRCAADQDLERRRRVEESWQEAEAEQRAYTQEQLADAFGGRLELAGSLDDRRVAITLAGLTRLDEDASVDTS